jgi:HAMP domain-containing protein
MGIRARFGLIIGIIGLIALATISTSSYWFSLKNAKIEAARKAEIIANYQQATRLNFLHNQRPLINELIEQDRFYPELMSGFALSRMINELFKKSQPGYTVKDACLNPLRPSNMADKHEQEIISTFQTSGSKFQTGMVEKNGKTFFFRAKPVPVKKGCLSCHGDPLDAAKDQVAIYGEEQGYNWKAGEINSAFIIYIPFDEVLAEAQSNALKVFLVGVGLMIFCFVVFSVTIYKYIVEPVVRLSARAEEISLGKKLDETVSHDKSDEIGALATSINRLRISIERMLKR